MVSIILPAFREPYLSKTIESILESAKGEIEVIPVLDGYTPDEPLPKDKRVKPIFLKENQGMRNAINVGIVASKGKWIMKSDAHCLFAEGFDEVLTRDCKKNWLMIPRRYSVNAHQWSRSGRIRDYCYLSYPQETAWGYTMSVVDWFKKNDKKIDDILIFQGSCWFANKEYFIKNIGLLDEDFYSPFGYEQLEIRMKYLLAGGEAKVNKNTWYAHLHKGMWFYKMNKMLSKGSKNNKRAIESRSRATRYWVKEKCFLDLIDSFAPVPTWN